MAVNDIRRITDARSVLVTGGAGFIGSHLCGELLKRGCAITVIDDLRSGSIQNISDFLGEICFKQLTVGDPTANLAIRRAFEECDFVFHLASSVGVSYVHRNPLTTYESITRSGALVVELCCQYGLPLLLTSSSEVYGADPECPTHEGAPLTNSAAARFSYAAAKIALENIALERCVNHATDTWIVRLFNIAGPRQRPEAGVVSSFAAALADGSCPTVHGDGSQTRSFLHVSDAINALLHVAECERLVGKAVNVGSENPVRIAELAALMCKVAEGQHAMQVSYSEAFGDGFEPVLNRQPCTRLLRTMTDWRPSCSLEDIIRDCIQQARLETQSTNENGRIA